MAEIRWTQMSEIELKYPVCSAHFSLLHKSDLKDDRLVGVFDISMNHEACNSKFLRSLEWWKSHGEFEAIVVVWRTYDVTMSLFQILIPDEHLMNPDKELFVYYVDVPALHLNMCCSSAQWRSPGVSNVPNKGEAENFVKESIRWMSGPTLVDGPLFPWSTHIADRFTGYYFEINRDDPFGPVMIASNENLLLSKVAELLHQYGDFRILKAPEHWIQEERWVMDYLGEP